MIGSKLFFVLQQRSFPIGFNKVHQFYSILLYSRNLGHNFIMTRLHQLRTTGRDHSKAAVRQRITFVEPLKFI